MKNINKAELIELIAKNNPCTKKEADEQEESDDEACDIYHWETVGNDWTGNLTCIG